MIVYGIMFWEDDSSDGGICLKYTSIKWKLYFLIFLMIIPIFILQIYRVGNRYSSGLEKELDLNNEYAEAIEVSFDNYLDRIWDTELSIGLSMSSHEKFSQETMRTYMSRIAKEQPSVHEYDWITPNLIIAGSSYEKAVGVQLAGLDYINRILNGEDKVVSEVINSRVYNTPTIVVARAIRQNGRLKGIVAATIDMDKINLVLPAGRTTQSSSFGLIDNKGNIVYDSGGNGNDSDAGASVYSYGGSVPGSIDRGNIEEMGKDNILANIPVSNIGWTAYSRTSNSEIFQRVSQGVIKEIALLALMLVICVIAVLNIGKRIVEPITILQSAAQEISRGKLNIRTNIRGNDEIAAAAQAFDHMAMSIEEYDRLKTEFFSTISHELKTPLNIILSSVQMLEGSCSADRMRECSIPLERYTGMMKQNSYRLLRLINNLIDINRIDSGFMKVNLTNNDIVSIVEDITLSVVDYAESKGISLVFDTQIEEEVMACDPDKIERIMLNLLSNSIKFTNPGGSICVNAFKDNGNIKISVRDTGIGIPEDKMNIIFDRFRQVDSSLHREYEGSGIGLSLVKALVEANGGTISVKSREGFGTEFVMELPIKILSDEEAVPYSEYRKQSIDRVEKINIEFSDV